VPVPLVLPSAADILGPLRIRGFALLWTGGLLSRVGNIAFLTGLSYFVYRETNSAAVVAGLTVAISIPGILFASGAGVIADRWDRKRQMIVVNLVQAAAMLPAVALTDDRLWLAYFVMFVDAGAGHFFLPAGEAALPSIVPEDELVRAYSWDSTASSIAAISGPVVGGLSFALWGIGGVAVVNSASFLASALLIARISLPRSAESPDPARLASNPVDREGMAEAFRRGLSLVGSSPGLSATLAVAATGLTAAALFLTVLVPFTNDLVGPNNPEGVGLVLGVRGAAGLLAGILIATIGRRFAPSMLLFASLAILSGTIVASAAASPNVALVLIVLSGVPAVAWFASNLTLVQLFTPTAYKGRVFGVYHTTRALSVLTGALIVLVVGDQVGLRVVIATSGVLVGVAAVLALRVPRTAS
jgi:predicted MFS family arabinose efflux permease